MDLPESYEFKEGNANDRFSFACTSGALFDIAIYKGRYNTPADLVNDVNKRLSNKGSADFFKYRDNQAAIFTLEFNEFSGWGLVLTLESASPSQPVFLLALAYGPASAKDLDFFHISALDSLCPTQADRRYPGPIMEYTYPRGEKKRMPLALSGVNGMICDNDAIAAQSLIEREFIVLQYFANLPNWQNAWIRYYKAIYRDSYDRIAEAASMIVRYWGGPPSGDQEKRAFAQKALDFVQGFSYERDFSGSDFLNLVTAVTEGRGDCDSRAMLWAIVLDKSLIPASMMISRPHSHAMGLAHLTGSGARFESLGIQWLVAETTAKVGLGMIAQDFSDPSNWIGVIFD